MELVKVINGTIKLPESAARWLGADGEVAVLLQGDALILKKVHAPRVTDFAERAPAEPALPMKDIVAEVHRARKATKRARRP